jgi:phage major head subunit gpT-like protein
MSGPQVVAANLLTNGLLDTFRDAWMKPDPLNEALLDKVVGKQTSDSAQEIYAYTETGSYPKRKPRGRESEFENFLSRQFTVVNYDWEAGVSWHRNDRRDDKTKSLYDQARSSGGRFRKLRELLLFQMLLASANADLLPAIPNSPDGAAWFSATDGAAAARFGITNGNLLTGSTVGAPQNVVDDYYRGYSQILGFLNPKGNPIWGASDLDAGIVIIHNVADTHIFHQAFKQSMRYRVTQNVAAAENVGVTSVSNLVSESGQQVTLWGTAHISTHDWFMVLDGIPNWQKPIFVQDREALREVFANEDNSDESRKKDEEYILWKASLGVGQFLPYQSLMIDN